MMPESALKHPSGHLPSPGEKVIVGLSGGVDSSLSAAILKNDGYQVEGLFMKNWDDDDGSEYCTAQQDLEDALRVCDQLDIELHTVNFAREYWDNVFEHFLQEYRAGRTPNPDVLCNREIKFKVFIDHASRLDADWIATGHYVRTRPAPASEHKAQHTELLKGIDANKDQSYFLNAVPEEQLRKSIFPLGGMQKSLVRQNAARLGLHVSDKKDSTGICFIGERRFADFLNRYLPAQPGEIQTLEGNVIGEHNGLMYHTIGQRQGLGIGGVKGGNESPWYVAKKQLENNTLVVVQGSDHPALFRDSLTASEAHWITRPSEFPLTCTAKTRYRQPDQLCTVTETSDGLLKVVFAQSQRAITPGQYVVFYQQEICLGGAVIN